MIDGEGASGPRVRTVRRDAVRLKTPAHWLRKGTRATLPTVDTPPQYKPHPDTLACLERCLWCLTLQDTSVPAKIRRCPCCGKSGKSSYPLYTRLLFVEYF